METQKLNSAFRSCWIGPKENRLDVNAFDLSLNKEGIRKQTRDVKVFHLRKLESHDTVIYGVFM